MHASVRTAVMVLLVSGCTRADTAGPAGRYILHQLNGEPMPTAAQKQGNITRQAMFGHVLMRRDGSFDVMASEWITWAGRTERMVNANRGTYRITGQTITLTGHTITLQDSTIGQIATGTVRGDTLALSFGPYDWVLHRVGR
ncbi:MAG: hypothetical protein ACT4O1_11930 [Gemmatimonadota bacterium]